jgi:limonene 1,2-monooxygenase
VGAGLLTSDAKMLGIPTDKQRDRMVESLEIILRLLAGEVVTHRTDWFQLDNARLHLQAYTQPRPTIAVASAVTPSGGKMAGKHGLGLLGMAAASAKGFAVLGTNWDIAQREAAEHQQILSRSEYRLVAPFHIAESRSQALTDVKEGFDEWADYTRHINPDGPASLGMDSPEFINESGNGAIGSPDDGLAALERFWAQSGGFGSILHFGQSWASAEATKRSYTLFAEYVMPKFAQRNRRRFASLDWMASNVSAFSAASKDAVDKSIAKHTAAAETKRVLPGR